MFRFSLNNERVKSDVQYKSTVGNVWLKKLILYDNKCPPPLATVPPRCQVPRVVLHSVKAPRHQYPRYNCQYRSEAPYFTSTVNSASERIYFYTLTFLVRFTHRIVYNCAEIPLIVCTVVLCYFFEAPQSSKPNTLSTLG